MHWVHWSISINSNQCVSFKTSIVADISPEKLSELRKRVQSLTDSQRVQLKKALEAQGIQWDSVYSESTGGSNLKLVSTPRPETIELTPSQAHVWVLHQLFPDLCAYHIGFAWKLEGELSVSAFSEALTLFVERHQALRTVFVQDSRGRPKQALIEAKPVLLDPVTIDENRITEESETYIRSPFQLDMGPLYRFRLLRINERRHVLFIVLHHLIADGWSRGVLLRDLARAYRLASNQAWDDDGAMMGQSLDTIHYSVFHADQEWGKSQEKVHQLSYWTQQLDGMKLLEIPTDRPSPAKATFASQTLTRALSRDLTEKIHNLGREHGATLFMTLLTAFKCLLYRYTNERDLAVGVPVSGRRFPECADLIGFFVNTIVLRSRFPEGEQMTFLDCLSIVKKVVLEGLEHQFVPFSDVVEACAPQRHSHRNPLFEVMFQVQSDGYQSQNAARPDVTLPGLYLSQVPLVPPETKFDLTWHVFDRAEGLMIAVEFRTALMDSDRIERMMGHYEHLLQELVVHAQKPVHQLTFLGKEERQLLTDFSKGVRKDWPKGMDSKIPPTFYQAFVQQVIQTPQALAVRSRDDQLTFTQLNQEASKLAEELTAQAICIGTPVGIRRKRHTGLVVAILAVMRVGGVYVPLDPELPEARLDYMRRDAGCSWVIEEDGLRSFEPAEPVDPIVNKDACYILYTSGSTGKPKGVVITHRGLMHYLTWSLQEYPYEAGWGAPVQSSFGFDATITTLLAPLLCGKTVELLAEEDVLGALVQSMQTGPSLVKLTPAHLAALEHLIPHNLDPNCLPKALVVGGEALTARHVKFWREHYPDVLIYNEYGPTETVVGCCVHQVEELDLEGAIPIGRPISGVQLYNLDEQLQSLPIGIAGELFIGGPGVANGYVNRPELSDHRFLPDPFHAGSNRLKHRLYRTGDRVRWRSDGVMEYLGRMDRQIQLRGYRIELGEIEAVLRSLPYVQECVVEPPSTSARNSEQVQSILVAYLQMDKDQFDPKSLKQALQSELPEYMTPTHFERMDRLPLTSNGKIDHAKLPEVSLLTKGKSAIAPRNEIEAVIQNVWRDVLEVHEVGMEDNFFELGGDSIRAMQIISGARQAGWKLTPVQLFDNQTVAAQAAVAKKMTETTESSIPSGRLSLGPAQKGFFGMNPPHPNQFNQGVLLMIDPKVDSKRLFKSIQEVVRHHDSLRLRFTFDSDGQWAQQYEESNPRDTVLEDVDLQSFDQFSEVLDKEIASRQEGFDLKSGKLFRAARFRGPGGEDRLMLLAHHCVVDGMSWRILLEDIETVYAQLGLDEPPVLPPKSTSFGEWIRNLPESNTVNQPIVTLFPKPSENRWIDSASVLRECQMELQPEEETLVLTGLAQTLSQFTRSSVLPIDIERHGRHPLDESTDLIRTVGWFTSLHSLHLKLPDAGLVVQRNYVQDKLQSIPPGQSGQVGPTAQVSFNYLGNLNRSPGKLFNGLASEQLPCLNHPDNPRHYLLEIIAYRLDQSLKIIWRFHQKTHEKKTVQMLADRHLSTMESIVTATKNKVRETQSPSVRGDLNQLMAKLNARKG